MLGDLVQRSENALVDGQVIEQTLALLVHLGRQRAIPGFHRIGATGHLDDRRVVEMLGKALQIDGRRGDDQLEIGAARQQGLQVAEQEVDVEAAFVRLVDDDGVVLFQKAVVLGFGEQDAVGHQLDQRAVLALILETHLIADQLAQRCTDLLGHPRCHATRRQPTRLSVTDQAMHAPANLQTDLRQLGGLARAGLAGDHHHLALLQRGLDLVALGGDRQRVVVAHGGDAAAPRRYFVAGRLKTLQPLRQLGLIGLLLQLMQLPTQAMTLGDHDVVEVLLQRGEVSHLDRAIRAKAGLSQITPQGGQAIPQRKSVRLRRNGAAAFGRFF